MADSKTNIEQEQIQFILRQTDYTYDEAREKLIEFKNDYMTVIRSYLKQGVSSTPIPKTKPLSMNQQIYKEIRTFMDEADLTQVKPSQ